ncbi:uncharacterized protein G2W53_015673 [Senna tora]|uniref:Putative plant transposon protein domain-containing protein n=1 Tax=Senna tora TaxID=362788 RepID=A0A835C853_9FABA|nr:uncharacterized protein G2W53_015673 [Senna tora]
MASKAIVKRKASSSPTKTVKRPKHFLDEAAKTRFDDNIKYRGICMPREVNFEFFDKEPGLTVFQMFSLMGPFFAIKEKVYPTLVKEFYANLSFSELDGEIVGKSMLRGKKIDLTMKNLRMWIALKEGDFKRYFNKEPISMEAYSYEKAVKKISGEISDEIILGQLGINERLMAHVLSQMILPKAGTSNDPSKFDIFLMWCALKGWEPDLAFIILNHMKDTLARPNADLPYGSLITIIARYRGVVFIHDDFCEDAAQAIYDSRLILNMSYRKIDGAWMNVKHGRQPPKTAGRRKSSRLLKKESSTPSSPIQVSEEEKATEEEDSDATIYSDSPTSPDKTEETMHSTSSNKESPQDDTLNVTSQPSATDPASGHEPDHEDHPDLPNPIPSPKTSASSPEPTLAPLTPLAVIRAHLRSLTAQVTTALEEIQELKKMVTEMTLNIGNAGHPDDPSNVTPSSAP